MFLWKEAIRWYVEEDEICWHWSAKRRLIDSKNLLSFKKTCWKSPKSIQWNNASETSITGNTCVCANGFHRGFQVYDTRRNPISVLECDARNNSPDHDILQSRGMHFLPDGCKYLEWA